MQDLSLLEVSRTGWSRIRPNANQVLDYLNSFHVGTGI